MKTDIDYMSMAIDLAKSAKGQTSPNPLVGAIVVKNGTIVGMGAHLRAGEPHAEIHALKMAGNQAVGSTLYVSLEPCSHHGKTPPCTDAILSSGVRKVVVATKDPNPLVAGSGVDKLKEAGLEVVVGIQEQEAIQLNEVFFHYVQSSRPFVTLKTASTLDGKIATCTGHSRWITGVASREEVHDLRRMHDAILVGVGTVLSDDPELTARHAGSIAGKQPIRIILDRQLRTPLNARVTQCEDAKTWIITTSASSQKKTEELTAKGVTVITLDGELQINHVLAVLGERGITSLLVEGGAEINAAFLQAKAIQKIISYVSLKLVGGKAAPSIFGGIGYASMDDAIRLVHTEIKPIDEQDIRIVGYPQWMVERGQ
ncbi:bifunctional diaminohydroxyphosphoribosylaminopyrimidine deaminase/5-amino-6-(5-phosphoribosylamino)uracil reductase RibD [Brevibacillus invocatus]|uniref:bifunctional diaminohydroxyphosphoribosylaminopyrimidine deaminase/5-amino-6-(5-phosphoribosylamino)uracil reductase RibD n=1 Tax=Brevibacillus invocatus TaxID=173959 RepID=UPI00203F4572|nr:bifunctional diaminohydroxyphosphoribosylaminopyrimidine deaminase/5-amino-6-(5-phosphoribosylamino)uracil reductase RibD [Brevibacillus invocatus]MCM3077808.1 bifunctional diaminohydroxyphosphoribosylaminopyrimidine deaminase/5-amino-6-(5-phosphoribosylamino)uracil reductase RibD [Brevibacillus invocatus]MCM3428118.1 bifunctional diaminohydroxyphosphoribosylaminopyrimidine deaminase/5-amino-6-(5-phosphoribosylamino)uracil reductase RibD [Brevibacillus invocatus]